MIYLLDTNVLSEIMKPAPSVEVAEWMRAQPLRSVCTAAICAGEILAGIAVPPKGRRRSEMGAMAALIFIEDFAGRILPFDATAAQAYAELFAVRRQMGRPIETADLIAAATARAHYAAVVTRDEGGFEGRGVTIVNPSQA